MRALVTTPGGVTLRELGRPAAGDGEVLVAVAACGICGSDVHAAAAGRLPEGTVLGHEFAGRVAAIGPRVTGWQESAPVAVNPILSCGHCPTCRAGLPFRCPSRPNLGITAPGGFAEYVAVPAEQLVALPDTVEPWLGSRAEPLAVALRAVALGSVAPGEPVAVLGVGTIGLNVVLGLRLAGAGQIVAVGRSPGRRVAAAELGADVVLDARETSLEEWSARIGVTFAATFECAGSDGALAQCLRVLAPGGACVQVALAEAPATIDARALAGRGQRLIGSCAFTPADYEQAVEHLVLGRVRADRLVSARVGMEEGPRMFERLRAPGDLVGVLVEPWR